MSASLPSQPGVRHPSFYPRELQGTDEVLKVGGRGGKVQGTAVLLWRRPLRPCMRREQVPSSLVWGIN